MDTLQAPPLPASDTDPDVLRAVERRINPSKSFSPFKRARRSKSTLAGPEPPLPTQSPNPLSQISRQPSQLNPDVEIRSSLNDSLPDKDVYRWAVIYENQRGFTLFSIQLYSALSLLPTDPPPFTAEGSDDAQPEVSLTEYPLPDGTWEWVSNDWMIDMRDDSGRVSYDGFEYNWLFRTRKWHSDCKFGGFVRRRRYVRLMVHRARALQLHQGINVTPSQSSTQTSGLHVPAFDFDYAQQLAKNVWKGDEQDWDRCHYLMRNLRRDGLRLEIWREWLGTSLAPRRPIHQAAKDDSTPEYPQSVSPQLAYTDPDDERPHLVEPETIMRVLQEHHEDLFALFIFVESKAELATLLADRVGFLLNGGPRIQFGGFYSYTSDLSSLRK